LAIFLKDIVEALSHITYVEEISDKECVMKKTYRIKKILSFIY
jgi:hypothetical protein